VDTQHSEPRPFTPRWSAAIAAACEGDAFFREKASAFSRVISLQSGDAAVHFDIREGRVRSGADWPPSTTIGVRGTAADWAPILDGLPGGLHRAWREKRLDFVADPAELMDGYLVLYQLGERVVAMSGASE
jgi:hypothetical protein